MQLSDLVFDFPPDITEREDIARCLRMLILTPKGTCPMDRNFGIDNSYLDLPIPAAQNKIAVEIIDQAEIYEPRIRIREVTFTEATNRGGNFKAKVVIEHG